MIETFAYRDARRQVVSNAMATLPPDDTQWRPALEVEDAALQGDDWRVTDRTYLMVGAQWLWATRAELKLQVDDDPALLALGLKSALTAEQAAAIEIELPPAEPTLDYLDVVRAQIGNDEAIFAELLHAAHRRWIVRPVGEQDYPYDDAGVLLPLRLETLFDKPASEFNAHPTRWQLLLRVTPDEAAMRRDNGHVSPGEQEALLAFWRDVWRTDVVFEDWLEGEEAAIAWHQLCARVRPARAAWLVSEVEVHDAGDGPVLALPPDMPPDPQPNRVGGLPPELHVTLFTTEAIDGKSEHPVGRLPMDEAATIRSVLPMPPPQELEDERSAWWNSWQSAVDEGLGGQWLLAEGITPHNIEALYVVGIGDESSDGHFRAQASAGDLSVLRLGTATNVVGADAPASDFDDEAETWRGVARKRLLRKMTPDQTTAVEAKLQRYLFGSPHPLPFFPGAALHDDTGDSRLLMAGLWPSLWGHWQRDMWQAGDDAYREGVWMLENFYPEGPLLPLRIGDQPYGLLPVTPLREWHPELAHTPEMQRQREVEARMVARVGELVGHWANFVRVKQSAPGKTIEEFMKLLGQDAVSRGYLQRPFLPAWYPTDPLGWSNDQRGEWIAQSAETYRPVAHFFADVPATPYLASGPPRPVRLPLVRPTRMIERREPPGERAPLEEVLIALFGFPPNASPEFDLVPFLHEANFTILPDSLLLRLLFLACQLAGIWRQSLGGSQPEAQLLQSQEEAALDLARQLDDPGWAGEREDPYRPGFTYPTIEIPTERLAALERAFRATLDSAAHRVDPWISGFGWQRWRQQSASWRAKFRLGAYGWLDGPFDGAPGPTDAGRLHTPSYNQTVAALIMRDKFLSSQRANLRNEQGDLLWQMNITSRTARLAVELAEEVRLGFHIYEVLGRRVEQIAATHENVRQLRTDPATAMTPQRPDLHEVCNGEAALRELLREGGGAPFNPGPSQRTALQELEQALDVYADLLVADGAMQLVNREVERAAATMDAAAGFSRPPAFDFLHTPPSGYRLESIVVSVLPFVDVQTLDISATPARVAEPSLAAFLEARLGSDWAWQVTDEGVDGPAIHETVTLADMRLAPIDSLALSDDVLCDLARGKVGRPHAQVSIPPERELARQIAAALGNRPAVGRDLTENAGNSLANDPTARAELDDSIRFDLRVRYLRLHREATILVHELLNAPEDVARAAALRRALYWGVIPATETSEAASLYALLASDVPPADGNFLSTLAQTAAAVVSERLSITPNPTLGPLPEAVSELAQAITALAAPGAALPILTGWTFQNIVAALGLDTTQPAANLDETWLTVVAAPRAALARLEALQLALEATGVPLASWCSAPHDPWQTSVVAQNRAAREQALGAIQTPRFAAAYGPQDALGGATVAVGLIDAFGEAIPLPQRSTMAAFGFNAPAARAPQAILLVAPPAGPRQRIGRDLLLQTLLETRELAQARTARMEVAGHYQALLPSTWLPTNGPLRMRFAPYPLAGST